MEEISYHAFQELRAFYALKDEKSDLVEDLKNERARREVVRMRAEENPSE